MQILTYSIRRSGDMTQKRISIRERQQLNSTNKQLNFKICVKLKTNGFTKNDVIFDMKKIHGM
jgi:hypothetical protein